uniref:Putative dual kunitz salivary protein n=1 Tax=Ornithodoros turicata TaxID=34597 RepID=A0A2R5LFU9_9ACAR
MEAKVFVCILMFLLAVCHSARGIGQCTNKRQRCRDPTALRRYFFNEKKKKCSSFFVCAGENGDNFYPSMIDCVKECSPGQRQPKCFRRMLAPCRGDTPGETAWTHNPKTKKCEKVENACGGKNKFASKDECVAECFGFDNKKGQQPNHRRNPGKKLAE